VRIEDMRSGFGHLRKKVSQEVPGNNIETKESSIQESGSVRELVCDLAEPLWSVVSFDEVEAGGLTYFQAVNIVSELDASGIPGLCIITDKAARVALAR
jgi:hypothetical protein